MSSSELSVEMNDCIELCLDCHKVCTELAGHTVGGSNEGADTKHSVTLLDCAQICLTHADFMARRSSRHAELAKVCADICRDCAASCEPHADNDEKMKHCVEVCRKCEESCRHMASSTSSGSSANETSAPQGTGAIATPTSASGGGNHPVEGTGAGVTQFT